MNEIAFKIKKSMTPTNLGFLAALLAAIAALWAQKEQSKDSEKLIKAQEEIIRLTKEGLNSVTGGNGYCFVNFYPTEGGQAELSLISTSKYPLYDIEMTVQRWLPFDDINTSTIPLLLVENFKKSFNYNEKFYYKIASLAPMEGQKVSSKELGLVPFRAIGYEYYTIDFSARNGEWRQIWEAVRMQGTKDKVSHIVYKKVFQEEKVVTNIMLNGINPESPDSFLNDLIMEWKLK